MIQVVLNCLKVNGRDKINFVVYKCWQIDLIYDF